MNLPVSIHFLDDKQIKYIYDATGTKLQKQIYVNNNLTSITSYAGAFIYEKSSLGGSEQLQFFSHAEGYVEKVDQVYYKYVYQYKDHLGNIRLSYQDMNNDGNVDSSEIQEENNYYPFGLKHKGYNNTITGRDHKYGYGNKEEQDELGLEWMDFHARNYDAALGRFMNVDLLAEIAYDLTPYHYVSNSPIWRIDPSGLTDYTINKETGEVRKVENTETEDGTDRVLETIDGEIQYKKNGEAKVSIGNVKKGLLKDGHNFQDNDIVYKVTADLKDKEILSFIHSVSMHVDKEIAGHELRSSKTSESTSEIWLSGYTSKATDEYVPLKIKSNMVNTTTDISMHLAGINTPRYLKARFHTHLRDPKSINEIKEKSMTKDGDVLKILRKDYKYDIPSYVLYQETRHYYNVDGQVIKSK
ncbi:hypothetical protein I5168_07990 [Nonlabens sp. SCSIO 43208]|uniref:RHS repeat domain-containing protein n=1 Tax=Nonlabens sp. SCSIO 43208 TaxID=2793009 RepID=UPI003D6BFFEC